MKKLNKILLIDDDQITNYINKDLLESLDIVNEVEVMEDGGKAFEYLSGCNDDFIRPCPELVIFDHEMSYMDGRELIEALHKTGFIKDGKVVFMYLNAHSRPQDIEALRALGVHEFGTKPLRPEKVMDVYQKYWHQSMHSGLR